MAFSLASLFGLKAPDTTPKTLAILKHRCPQNHRCPAVAACPVGALSQKGQKAPTVDRSICINCGKCSRYCFPKALVMKKA
ncbi:MAG: 4Fe-4S ferredoxin [Spirochaetales bacterium]|jgi:Fe-S-cluster-containing hydrogenase component 2|nr:4Fe-4S ferredoxin [Spirochaetales bacterium]